MPSPFPGMDPYLERPAYWRGVHSALIVYACSSLNTHLPKNYVANIEERVYIVQEKGNRYPDVLVTRRPPANGSNGSAARVRQPALAGAGVETAVEVADAPLVVALQSEETYESFINIVRVDDQERVVTAIEILSPANKRRGHEGRQSYLDKQREMLDSPSHFLEIDLLRVGEHTLAVPVSALEDQWNYLICLHRRPAENQPQRFEVWPSTLRERLPRVAVPLDEGDADVVLDLQKVLTRCYDEGAFERKIDYRKPPQPPLEGDDKEWADALLHEKGLRS